MSRIESMGSYLPSTVIDNTFFSNETALFDSIDEYFTGFNLRRHCEPHETALFMAVQACLSALANSQYQAEDIDAIVGALLPSRHLYGDDLNLIQHQIGAWSASVTPINTACSTFLSSLNLADSLIKSGKKRCVLVVTATDWVSNSLDTKAPNYGFAGNAAGAVILDNQADSLIDIHEVNKTTPDVFDAMVMQNPQFSGQKEYFKVVSPEGISTKKDLILFPISVAQTLLDRNPDINIDKMITHQSGIKMMEMWADKLGIPRHNIRHTIDLYANMVSVNVPVTLCHWVNQGDIVRGDVILLFTPAAGGHYIAMLWRY